MHSLKSPQNVGTIVRSHVAFGGGPLVFVGQRKPWEFRKGTQAFSRKLERLAELVFLPDDDSFFGWCEDNRYTTAAVEISWSAVQLPQFVFPDRPAVGVGNESVRHDIVAQQVPPRCVQVLVGIVLVPLRYSAPDRAARYRQTGTVTRASSYRTNSRRTGTQRLLAGAESRAATR